MARTKRSASKKNGKRSILRISIQSMKEYICAGKHRKTEILMKNNAEHFIGSKVKGTNHFVHCIKNENALIVCANGTLRETTLKNLAQYVSAYGDIVKPEDKENSFELMSDDNKLIIEEW